MCEGRWIAYIFSSVLIGVFLLLGVALARPTLAENVTVLDGSTDWESDWSIGGDIVIRGQVTIPEGIRLTIDPGSAVTVERGGNMSVLGVLDIRGTTLRPVSVSGGGGYSISVFGAVYARHTTFSGGGVTPMLIRNFFIATAYAWDHYGVISLRGMGRFEGTHCIFVENTVDISMRDTATVRVWASEFRGPQNVMVVRYGSGSADFRYNFWEGGDPQGLKENRRIPSWLDTDHWTDTQHHRDPVVIVPGILGSWQWTPKGVFVLDPIQHTYDALEETFTENGYEEGKDLFVFPYDWRQSNVETERQFRVKMEEIHQITQWPLVDVVAHSMGGLVARQYIASDLYENDIDELVTLGTPHNGSPKGYLMWEGGEVEIPGISITGSIIDTILFQEAKENGYASIFEYIRRVPIASVQELLPIYGYLQREGTDKTMTYPDGYPRNEFLERLAGAVAQEALRKVGHINIEGRVSEETITKISVGEPVEGAGLTLWEHGKPEGYDDFFGSHGLVFGTGDGTVPMYSNATIFADVQKTVSVSHGAIPDSARDLVFTEITGSAPGKKIASALTQGTVVVQAMSPINIAVEDSEGNRVGVDFETGESRVDIEGAFYTGPDALSEFLTLPNPKAGIYTVWVRGTGDGSYGVRVTSLVEKEDGGTTEAVREFSGVTNVGSEARYTFVIDDAGSVEEEVIESRESEDVGGNVAVVSVEEEVSVGEAETESERTSEEKKSSKKKKKTSSHTKASTEVPETPEVLGEQVVGEDTEGTMLVAPIEETVVEQAVQGVETHNEDERVKTGKEGWFWERKIFWWGMGVLFLGILWWRRGGYAFVSGFHRGFKKWE